MKYTKNDVIMWPDDEKLEGAIGKEVFADYNPCSLVKKANDPSWLPNVLADIGPMNPSCEEFIFKTTDGDDYPFIILKKEPGKKTVQLDFDIREDREMLRGKTLIHNNPLRSGDKEECEVKGFFYDASDERWYVVISDLWGSCASYCEQNLFHRFIFADTGKRVGKEVEE